VALIVKSYKTILYSNASSAVTVRSYTVKISGNSKYGAAIEQSWALTLADSFTGLYRRCHSRDALTGRQATTTRGENSKMLHDKRQKMNMLYTGGW
jgi:hypothetical protein